MAVTAVLLLGGTLPAPLYGIYQQQIGFSEIVLTLVFGAYFFAALAALLFLGETSQQIGRRVVLFGSLAAAAASTVAFIFARGLPLLFVGRALSGLSVGWALPAATAFAAELYGGENAEVQTGQIASLVQMAGLGAGPLLAGLLAQYAPLPTLLSFYVFLGLLAGAALLLWRTPETIAEPTSPSFWPQLGVPDDKRSGFLSIAATGFCTFAMVGLYTSVAASVVKQRLGLTSHAVAGAIAFELFLFGTLSESVAREWAAERAILAALAGIPLGLVPLMFGVVEPSTILFLLGTAIAGLGVGLGFGKTLAALNEMADDEGRTKLLRSYFLVTYSAAVLPVIGIGIITQLGHPLAADITFATVVGLLALTAIAMRLRSSREASSAPG